MRIIHIVNVSEKYSHVKSNFAAQSRTMLGERLAKARKRAGMAQIDLAVALDKDRTLISHVESNRNGLLVDGLAKAAKELNVSTDYLLGLTDDPTPAAELSAKVSDLTDPEALVGVSAEIYQFPGTKPVSVHRLATAAGSGALDLDESVKTYAWFRSEWLSRKGLVADQCAIISVAGESMEPSLPDGCVILIDRNRTRRRSGQIFVVRTEDGLIVKRLGKDEQGNWQLLSDHEDWEPAPWPEDAVIIGEVKWSAREW